MKVMEEEQVLSDRMQMVIGGVISLVLASAYVFFTGDRVDDATGVVPVIEPTTTSLITHEKPDSAMVGASEPPQSESKPATKPEKGTPQ